jgi:hypothetical protein
MLQFKKGDRVKYIGRGEEGLNHGESGIVKEVGEYYSVQFSDPSDFSYVWHRELVSLECPVVESVKPQLEATGGTKHDGGKPDLSLISSNSIVKIAEVLTYGKTKYDANNWRKGMKWTRVSSAVLRHIFAWLGGQDKDPETGISHLAHAACGLIFLLEFEDTHPELDDRYKGA